MANRIDERMAKTTAAQLAKRAQEIGANAPEDDPFENRLDTLEITITNGLLALAEELGVEVNEEDLDRLFDVVVDLPPDSEGQADVRDAFAHFLDALEEIGAEEVYKDGPDAQIQKSARAAFRAQQAENRRAAAE